MFNSYAHLSIEVIIEYVYMGNQKHSGNYLAHRKQEMSDIIRNE